MADGYSSRYGLLDIERYARLICALDLAIPHLSTAEFRGYHIPEGTAIIGNAWALLHDPAEYPEHHLFKPERFLTEP